jgi:acetyl esterase/lipase
MNFVNRLATTDLGDSGKSAPAVGGANRLPRLAPRGAMCGRTMVGLALLGALGCGGSGSADPATSTSTGGAPGTGGASSSSGGATTSPVGTGGSAAVPGGTGGSTGTVRGTGGASSGGAGAGTGGSATGGRANTGGAAPSATGGQGATTGPTTPPVRDAASRQPVAGVPAGYRVESNFAYGPLATQRLDVLYPNDAGPSGTRTLPAVLMFHGGGWVHNFNDANGKDRMSTFSNRYLAHGFIVFTAEYRVANSAPEAAFAPAAVTDALLAAKWCWDYLDYFHGDKARYVVTGASAGGHLAMMVGMITPAAMLGPTSPTDFKIAAIVDGYGPADIESELGGVAAGWLPSSLPNRAAIAKLVNPMTYVRMDIPPMIAVQGALDNTAPVAHTRNLIARLQAVGADVAMHEVPGAGHGFTTPASAWPDAEPAMFNWLTARGIGK